MTFSTSVTSLAFAAVITCALPTVASADHDTATSYPDSVAPNDTVEKIARTLRPIFRPGNGKYVVLPKIYYSSEAGLGFGVELGRAFQWGRLYAADSDVRIRGRVTVEGDGAASVTLNLGWLDKKYNFKTKLEYDDIPRSFYGVGADTPESNRETYQGQSILYYIEVFRRITEHFRMGVRGEAQDYVMLEVEEGGLLDARSAPGDHTAVAGAGILAFYDSRERRYSPRRGSYHQFFWLRFGSIDGRDYEFNVFNADFRWYIPVRLNDVLAVQLFTYITDERPPFFRLASIGGRAHSRGYRRGRYIDEVMAAAQLEYRTPVWWRVGLVGFAGMAEVAPIVSDLRLEHTRPTVGGGARFLLGRNWGHARFDIAYGDQFRFYFRLDEAF